MFKGIGGSQSSERVDIIPDKSTVLVQRDVLNELFNHRFPLKGGGKYKDAIKDPPSESPRSCLLELFS